jgi:hypothetical protein
MSTRSHIMCEVGDDRNIISSYCHMDGYIDGVGKTLLTHYNDPLKAYDLVKIGYMSSCCDTIEEIKATRVNKDEPIVYRDLGGAFRDLDPLFIEYVYFWDGKAWNVSFAQSVEKPSDALQVRYGNHFYYHSNFKRLDDLINSEVA